VNAIYSGLLIIVLEIGVVALVCGVLYLLTAAALSRISARRPGLTNWASLARRRARNILIGLSVLLGLVILGYNGWLMSRGVDAKLHTAALIESIDRGTWIALALACAKLTLSAIGLVIASRLLRRVLHAAERAINQWDRVNTNNASLRAFFGGLEHVIVITAWLLLAALACRWFGLPLSFSDTLLLGLRIYLVIVVGVLIIRSTTVIVDTLDGWAKQSAQKRGWARHYDHVRPLVPTFRACLEYALWIALGSLVLLQLGSIGYLAAWGPRLIQAIGVFFAGRLVVELGSLEIGNRMLPKEGLEEADRRRRETMYPLVRTAFTYAVYFGTAVLILSRLGFNPMPFLAGAGILGVVIGFGAQSLINDLVCGFFILFENTYLVGDIVEVGDAKGVVEGIDFRTTRIRDRDGRVHVIRNGEAKPVINYSKEYTRAVVAVDVGYDTDLRAVFSTLDQAGQSVRAENPDVLDDVELGGITAFGSDTMTVRVSARVKPGRHDAVAADLRFRIKEMFDRQAPGVPRRKLIPGARTMSLVTVDANKRTGHHRS